MSGNQGDTGQGFIAGVEPAQPRQAAEWNPQTPAQAVSQPVTVVEQQPPAQPQGRFYTEEDLIKARQQEKDKLYNRIETMGEQLKRLEDEREQALRSQRAEQERLDQERREKEEAEMGVRQLMEKREQEWNDRFKTLEQQREQDRAVYERERQLQEVEAYRFQRVQQEAEFIMPELRDLIRGNDISEIDASIEEMKARTNAIMGNINAVVSQPQMPTPRGAAPTAPPVGPMEQLSVNQQLTPEDIRSMDIETYKKYRDSLLASASRQYRGR